MVQSTSNAEASKWTAPAAVLTEVACSATTDVGTFGVLLVLGGQPPWGQWRQIAATAGGCSRMAGQSTLIRGGVHVVALSGFLDSG